MREVIENCIAVLDARRDPIKEIDAAVTATPMISELVSTHSRQRLLQH